MADESLNQLLPGILALLQRYGFETLTKDANDKRMRFVGRVPATHNEKWLAFVHYLELTKRDANGAWGVDVSKSYFLPEGEGADARLKWAWRIIIQSDKVPAGSNVAALILPVLRDMPQPMVELPDGYEQPLHASPNRHNKVTPYKA